MLGMHGTVFANFAVDEADLLLAFGVRFDDRVTGKLETFASKARVVHIDIDPAEISKNKEAHIMVCADTRPAIRGEYLPSCLSVCQLNYVCCCTLQKDATSINSQVHASMPVGPHQRLLIKVVLMVASSGSSNDSRHCMLC